MTFDSLYKSVSKLNEAFEDDTAKAINRNITARNWLIGFYIVHYEQKGEDRAKYGEKTLLTGIKNNLIEDKSAQKDLGISDCQIGQSAIAQFTEVQIPPETLFTHLSFTHFSLIMSVEDGLARTFYELETIKGVWTVRELKRQIETNYFERSAISSNPQKMSEYVQSKSQKMTVTDIIKHPYVYEFLGLKDSEIVEESELEQSLMNHLEEFLMELGQGFCLEARQKRILVDDDYFFCDLVFYHRILKCHFLIDLKASKIKYDDIAQMNLYLSYYKKNIMQKDDNPPSSCLCFLVFYLSD